MIGSLVAFPTTGSVNRLFIALAPDSWEEIWNFRNSCAQLLRDYIAP